MRAKSYICITVLCFLSSIKITSGQALCSNIISYTDYGDIKKGTFQIALNGTGKDNYVQVKVFVSNNCMSSLCVLAMTITIDEADRRYRNGQSVPYSTYFRGTSKDAWVNGIALTTSNKCSIICRNDTERGNSVAKAMTHSLYLDGQTNSKIHQCDSSALFSTREMGCGNAVVDIHMRHLVINGFQIPTKSWPWLVALYRVRGGSGEFICGGTIISSRVILTAAHCLYERQSTKELETKDLYVNLGKHNLSNLNEEGNIRSEISSIIRHFEFRPNVNNFDADIALLITTEEIKFSEYIRPACVYDGPTDQNLLAGTNGMLVGWGATENTTVSDVPRAMKGLTILYENCTYNDSTTIQMTTKRNFCASSEPFGIAAPCGGDSGGGFFVQDSNVWKVRGVISATKSNDQTKCDLNKHVYTDVAKFASWIQAEIEALF